MKKMVNLPPSDYQGEQARKFREIAGSDLNVDDFDETLQNDEVFYLWDKMALVHKSRKAQNPPIRE